MQRMASAPIGMRMNRVYTHSGISPMTSMITTTTTTGGARCARGWAQLSTPTMTMPLRQLTTSTFTTTTTPLRGAISRAQLANTHFKNPSWFLKTNATQTIGGATTVFVRSYCAQQLLRTPSTSLMYRGPDPHAALSIDDSNVQLLLAEEEKKRRKAQRWEETLMIGRVMLGAVLGYVTARLIREVGRYCMLLYGAEAVALMLLTGSGILTREKSMEVLKYTFPPMEWVVNGLKSMVTGEFGGVYKTESIAFKTAFLSTFVYTLYQGGLFYGQAIGAWRRGAFL
eukprot:TRINITY_DN7713_c0_g1_i1.p1 TRINITY_DN7713_c0_g1~~TRINITY_DN7713_c0_g1_i1.p1  ORF type:complete len:284 (+),score=38.32 TRINITY_DN7713_c0_g1_i1:3-854(+)